MKKFLRKVLRWYGCHFPWHKGKGWIIYLIGPSLIKKGEIEKITVPNGLQMVLELDEFVQQGIYYWGWFEVYLVNWVLNHLQYGMVFIDVGGHVGQYTILAAQKVGRNGQVHSFEPHKQNYSALIANVKLNGLENCCLNNLALSDKNAEIPLYVQGENRHDVSIAEKTSHHYKFDNCRSIRLDDYVSDHNLRRVDMIKMDIEGAEWKALMGAAEILKRFHPTLILEVGWECHAFHYTRTEMVKWLGSFGYQFYLLDQFRPGKLCKIDNPESFQESEKMLICMPEIK